jgi:hypothetical protein
MDEKMSGWCRFFYDVYPNFPAGLEASKTLGVREIVSLILGDEAQGITAQEKSGSTAVLEGNATTLTLQDVELPTVSERVILGSCT